MFILPLASGIWQNMEKGLGKLWAFATLEIGKQYSSQYCFLLIIDIDEILVLKRQINRNKMDCLKKKL